MLVALSRPSSQPSSRIACSIGFSENRANRTLCRGVRGQFIGYCKGRLNVIMAFPFAYLGEVAPEHQTPRPISL